MRDSPNAAMRCLVVPEVLLSLAQRALEKNQIPTIKPGDLIATPKIICLSAVQAHHVIHGILMAVVRVVTTGECARPNETLAAPSKTFIKSAKPGLRGESNATACVWAVSQALGSEPVHPAISDCISIRLGELQPANPFQVMGDNSGERD